MGGFPLTRFHGFLLASAVLIGAVVVLSGLIVGGFFSGYVREQEKGHTAKIVHTQAAQHLAATDFDVETSRPGVFEVFLLELPDVFRIKVYDRRGRIVWSDEARLVGQSFPDNPLIAEALEGKVVSLLHHPAAAENVYERGRAYVVETYVPVTFPGRDGVVGVVEVYKDVSRVVAGIRSNKRRIWSIAAAMGVFLYISLAFVVWRASDNERRAIIRLETRNHEQGVLQALTSSLLQSLDPTEIAEMTTGSIGNGLHLSRAALCRLTPPTVLVPLATWTASSAEAWGLPDPRLVAEVVKTGNAVIRGRTVVAPLAHSSGSQAGPDDSRGPSQYLFVGVFNQPETTLPLVLDIMLNEAAIALANAELFTAIRDAHQRLAAIMAGIADRMVIVDREMRLVWMNAVAADTHGTDSVAVGRRCFEAFGQQPHTCQACPAARSFQSGKIERGVRTQRLPHGRVIYLDLVTAPLRDASGETHEVLEVARDITELVELEEKLKQFTARLEESNAALVAKTEELAFANRALRDAQQQLVANERLAAVSETVVSLHHAVLNPLAGILGALQVLGLDSLSDSARTEALARAEAEGRKIEQAIRSLSSLRRAMGAPYVGDVSMLDLESTKEREPS